MTIQQMLLQKYQVIADYPESIYDIGYIITIKEGDYCKDYPAIFKPLKWYQSLPVEAIASIKYAKVVEYVGYWRVGDVVEVMDYKIEKRPYLHISELMLKGGKPHPLDNILPATEEEYKAFRAEVEKALSGQPADLQ